MRLAYVYLGISQLPVIYTRVLKMTIRKCRGYTHVYILVRESINGYVALLNSTISGPLEEKIH